MAQWREDDRAIKVEWLTRVIEDVDVHGVTMALEENLQLTNIYSSAFSHVSGCSGSMYSNRKLLCLPTWLRCTEHVSA